MSVLYLYFCSKKSSVNEIVDYVKKTVGTGSFMVYIYDKNIYKIMNEDSLVSLPQIDKIKEVKFDVVKMGHINLPIQDIKKIYSYYKKEYIKIFLCILDEQIKDKFDNINDFEKKAKKTNKVREIFLPVGLDEDLPDYKWYKVKYNELNGEISYMNDI
jgi:hypothetical protein